MFRNKIVFLVFLVRMCLMTGSSLRFLKVDILDKNDQRDISSNTFSWKTLTFQNKYPQKFLGSRSKMGVYDKETFSCNGHSVRNIS